jgi:LuxR family maltose regulon positive regulatory protein
MKTKNELLSNREIEVLELIKQTYSNVEISKILIISIHTVKAHIKQIFRKLGAKSRLEAVVIGIKLGYIAIDYPLENLEENK